ncbi:hypothetical protein [Streptomyces alanosinicus]|uniref:Uncharacterized protein n=1 Tax=Streptomyces alanosinicus TaxID=68171 RepID=A0A918YLP6_9ACTN|nr:hypothetical protein [Streptomyces alanosinicus]GHE07347.1 hypothetical protein GCM10010339_52080 [Streptomyces alanosinicus]
MGHDPRGRGGGPSIHQAALDNLRRGSKPVVLFIVAIFGVMTLFIAGGLLVTKSTMPAAPSDPGSATGAGSTPAPSASSSPGAAGVRRAVLVAFLSDAVAKDTTRWFPGASAQTDGLTYTPLTSGDPGTDRPDGLGRVSYHDLPAADARAVLAAVSRRGTVRPDTLGITASTGDSSSWTISFEVSVRGSRARLRGEAEGYTTTSGASVIIRLVYPKDTTASPG